MDSAAALNDALRGSPYSVPAVGDPNELDDLVESFKKARQRHQAARRDYVSLSDELRTRLERAIAAQEVYESNAIEFTGLSLQDTEAAIEMRASSTESFDTYLALQAVKADQHLVDVLGLNEAIKFAHVISEEFQSSSRPLTEVDIRSLHKLTVPNERRAGQYKAYANEIEGSEVQTALPIDVEREVRELVEWINISEAEPVVVAAAAHAWLSRIHPFDDGNGRLARIIANVALLRSDWPPLIVKASDRLQYIDALGHSDSGGDIFPLLLLFMKSIEQGLTSIADPQLALRNFNADLRRSSESRYLLWTALITQFLNELDDRLARDDYVLERFEPPEPSSLLLLEDGNKEGNCWLAKAKRYDGQEYLLWLGYVSDRMLSLAPKAARSPSIFVSRRDRRPGALRPFAPPWVLPSIKIDEVTIRPTGDRQCAAVRYDNAVVWRQLEEAAFQVGEDIATAAW